MNGASVALPPGEEEVNLRAYWRVLVRRRALILRLAVVVTVGTACLMLLLPDIYKSTATLMPLAASRGSLSPPILAGGGLVYSLIGHRIGYRHSQEVSRCMHKRLP